MMFQGLFGGGGDPNAAYQMYANRALQEMMAHEAQGRGDISGYFQRGLGYEMPYMQAGQQGLQAYLGTLGLGGQGQESAVNRFRASPGYQFAQQQGQQAIQRQAAARGLGGGGAATRELARYGQGLADQQYGAYQNRLQGLASQGRQVSETAAGQAGQAGRGLAGLGEQYAGQLGSIYQGMGQSAANAEMMKQQRQQQMWKMLGELGGSAMGMFGGGMGGLGSLGGMFGGGGGGATGGSWLNPDTNQFYNY